jgi:acyl carrier protein
METKLKEIFIEVLEVENNFPINLDDDFRAYENWDSLAQLSLIAALDENFNIQIEQSEFLTLITVGDILSAITKRSNT